MGIPTIFIAFVIFIVVFRFKMNKNMEVNKKDQENFWTKESESHFVRKQTIDEADYLKANPDVIPVYDEAFYTDHDKPRLYRSQLQCQALSKEPLMDLSNMLNSDVRLKYGTGQLNLIETYENNYTNYIQHLNILSNGLLELEYYDDAKKLLEEAIKLGTDSSHIWINMGKTLIGLNAPEALSTLIEEAMALDSLMKPKIITTLKKLESGL